MSRGLLSPWLDTWCKPILTTVNQVRHLTGFRSYYDSVKMEYFKVVIVFTCFLIKILQQRTTFLYVLYLNIIS